MKRALLLLMPVLLGVGGLAVAHYPMLITEDSEVEPKKPLTIHYTNGHPWMNDRHKPADPTRVGVFLPGRPRFVNLMKKLTKVPGAKKGHPERWKLTFTPKTSGDYVFSWHCGVFKEPPNRQVADYAKLILHAKDKEGAQVGWRRLVGDPLEIMPLTRPYAIPVGTAFRGRVVWNTPKGKSKTRFNTVPWMKAVVEAETYTPDKSHGNTYLPHNRLGVLTDKNGVFVVTLTKPGWWLISCATDGGPGEQGATTNVAKRAVLWVKVGGTVFDKSWGPGSKPGHDPSRESHEKRHKHDKKHGHAPVDEDPETRHASRSLPPAPRVAVTQEAAAVAPAPEEGPGRWVAIAFVLLMTGGVIGAAARP